MFVKIHHSGDRHTLKGLEHFYLKIMVWRGVKRECLYPVERGLKQLSGLFASNYLFYFFKNSEGK